MIRTGDDYRVDPRQPRHLYRWRTGLRRDHASRLSLVDIRARIHDMQQDEAHRDILTWTENGQTNTISARLPVSQVIGGPSAAPPTAC